MFILADKKNKGLLNETEILSLLQQLNVTAPARVVKQKFKVCSTGFVGRIGGFEYAGQLIHCKK